MKNKIISIKEAEKIFPAEFTKLRLEDFIRIAYENKNRLTPKEFVELMKMYDLLHNPRYSKSFEFF